jgi:hypothetical protein
MAQVDISSGEITMSELLLNVTEVHPCVSHHACGSMPEAVGMNPVSNPSLPSVPPCNATKVAIINLLSSACAKEVVRAVWPDSNPLLECLDSWCPYPDRAALASFPADHYGGLSFQIYIVDTQRQRFVSAEARERKRRKYCTVAYASLGWAE